MRHGMHRQAGRVRVEVMAGALLLCALGACASAQSPAPRAVPGGPSDAHADAAHLRLRGMLDSIVGLARYRSAQWGVLIVDPERGDTLYSHNAGKLFVPASNEKLITAAVALAILGPDFRFTTRVAASGTSANGVLRGDVVLFGSGDPSFSDHVRGDAMIPLREMADSIKARGIVRIDGRLRRGRPVFTDTPIGYGWGWDDLGATFGAAVGDLMYNDAFAPVRVSVDGVFDTTAFKYPAYRNFLDAFGAALNAQGVNLVLPYDWLSPVPDVGLTTLFEYQSPPLSELLKFFTKPSQNQIGEILLKTLGLRMTGVGTADSGAAVVARRLLQWGADSDGFVVRDGSGLSRHDLVSPETLIRVLSAARADSSFSVFYNALPVAGVDGTLDHRMHGTSAAGNVHAKTGSMDRVRALSGYVTTADGRVLLFSVMANGWTVPGTEIDSTIDRIAERLAGMRIGS